MEIINPDVGSLKKEDIAAKLAKTLNVKSPECITIFGMKAKFGGGRTSGFACIFDDMGVATWYDFCM